MQLTRETPTSPFHIRRYTSHEIALDHAVFTTSLVLSPTECFSDWLPDAVSELTPAHLARCAALRPTVMIIGTGQTHHAIDPTWLTPLYAQGIGVEVMQSRHACSAYNVLMAERRNAVVTILLR
jgi:uncharacterized protein